eukprot:11040291-Lingulodinium_polyedra.AAC.1
MKRRSERVHPSLVARRSVQMRVAVFQRCTLRARVCAMRAPQKWRAFGVSARVTCAAFKRRAAHLRA